MEKIFIEQMGRHEVIQELRRHAHPTWFHSLLSWTTPRLKALLVYYREDAKEASETRRLERMKPPAIVMFGMIATAVRPGN